MLDKRTNPHLSRYQRRHPQAHSELRIAAYGVSGLTVGLLMRAGFWPTGKDQVPTAVSEVEPVGFLGRAKAAWRSVFGK